MKALAGVLLAFALTAGIGNEAGAKQVSRTSTTKHVAKTSVTHKKTAQTGCVCKAEKSKLVLTGRLNELNSLPTNCVCPAGTTKQVASTTTIKSKSVSSTGMMKTKSYGGYKPVNTTMMNTGKTGKGLHSNEGPNRSIILKPYVDSLNSNLDDRGL